MTVAPESAGERLDKYLLSFFSGYSRAKIQKLIKKGRIKVNGEACSPHHFLKEGDTVTIDEAPQPSEETPAPALPAIRFDLDIIEETDEYLVINKPAGISVHGAEHMDETTLTDLLLKKYPEIAKVGSNPDRPGIVHRLDKDVSGLMVVARNENSFENLASQFKDRTVKKIYTALVYGKVEKDDDTITFPIERSKRGFKMAAKPLNQPGKSAITKFSILKRFNNYTLLKIEIKTGRTHQIRAHMNAYNHPIVGDNLYSTRKTRLKNKEFGLGRVFLFACELEFTDLQGSRKSFRADIPGELDDLLKKIK